MNVTFSDHCELGTSLVERRTLLLHHKLRRLQLQLIPPSKRKTCTHSVLPLSKFPIPVPATAQGQTRYLFMSFSRGHWLKDRILSCPVTENVNKRRRRRRRGKERGKRKGTEQLDIELNSRRAEKNMEVVENDGRAS
jgi:hypothetical protein